MILCVYIYIERETYIHSGHGWSPKACFHLRVRTRFENLRVLRRQTYEAKTYLPTLPPTRTPTRPTVRPPARPPNHPRTHPPIRLSAHTPPHPPAHQAPHPPAHPTTYLPKAAHRRRRVRGPLLHHHLRAGQAREREAEIGRVLRVRRLRGGSGADPSHRRVSGIRRIEWGLPLACFSDAEESEKAV